MMTSMEQMEKMKNASRDARELAHKIAPFLMQLNAKLKAKGVSADNMTASYILLQAAAGFVASEEGRGAACEHLRQLTAAVVDDFLEPQIF